MPFKVPSSLDIPAAIQRALSRMKEYVDEKFVLAGPLGELVPFAGPTAPTDFMICNGQAVSRLTYSGLFAVVGTTWGVGDGSTTFNLPDLRGRTLIGAGTGAGLSARSLGNLGGDETHLLTADQSGLPSHNHTQNAHTHTQNTHGHTQDAHNHGDIVMPGTLGGNQSRLAGDYAGGGGALSTGTPTVITNLSIVGSYAYTQNATATNQNTVAVNQNATATNVANTAANAVSAHNNMQPFATVNWIIRVS
jgi:microcystin-dependent protein